MTVIVASGVLLALQERRRGRTPAKPLNPS
jgi:hypothetical protein